MKRFLLAALLLSASPAVADTLYFSAIPDDDETRLVERFGKVADYLSEKLGVDVEYVPVKDYAAAVSGFRNDQIQLAWFGGLSGVQARALVPGSRAIAQGAEDQAFVTYFIANKDAGIKPSDSFPDIAGHSFTFGAQTSTSGRLMPEYWIRKELGESPEQAFTQVGYSGDHGQTLRLVASGAYDVGALNYTVYDTAVAEGAPEVANTVLLWKTPTFPDYNWSIRGDVDERFGKGFADKVQAALVGMTDKDLLASFPRSAFIPADNEMYKPVEETARDLDIID